MSVQMYPFPSKPGLQLHEKEVNVFEQVAIAEQLLPIAQKSIGQEKPPRVFKHVDPVVQL